MPRIKPLPDLTEDEIREMLRMLNDPATLAQTNARLVEERRAKARASKEAWQRKLARRAARKISEEEGARRYAKRLRTMAARKARQEEERRRAAVKESLRRDRVPTWRWRHPRRPGWTAPPDYFKNASDKPDS